MGRKLKKPLDVSALLSLYASGQSCEAIAAQFGVTGRWVHRLLSSAENWPAVNRRQVAATVPDENGHRQCKTCRATKPFAEFHNDPRLRAGRALHCKSCVAVSAKAWRKANPDKQRYAGSWQHRNPEWRRKTLAEKYRSLKREILLAYGCRCASCGFSDERALHIDHVNDDGAEDRRRRTPLQRLAFIKAQRFPGSFQILCANCNTIKAVESGRMRFTRLMAEEAS